MVVVIILVKVLAKQSRAALEHIEKMKNLQHVHLVTGPYDIIIYADIPEKSGLRRFVEDIHDAPGVERTDTCMAL